MRNNFETPPKPKDALKLEHLKEGINPIMFCVGTPKQFKENPGAEEESLDNSPKNVLIRNFSQKFPKMHRLDFYDEDSNKLERLNFKNNGEQSYIISPVDSLDKCSTLYKDCTGVVATGKNKITGENISFLTHQSPHHFLIENQGQFSKDLTQRLEELKNISAENTIDAAIFGGLYVNEANPKHKNGSELKENRKRYLESIKQLSALVSEALGFEPVILTGPKNEPGDDAVFYDNRNKKLYIKRPEVGNGTTESYSPTDIEKQKKKWEQE